MAGVFAASHFDPKNYAKHRGGYSQELYEAIANYHAQAAQYPNNKELCIDLGCGPGQVASVMAESFQKVIATDPSESMLETCKSLLAEQHQNMEFEQGSAESLPFVEDASADLITAGTAAHWFPQEWWKEAHRILKPKGTVALFTAARGYFHPNTPHREEMQKLMDDVKRIHFDPYAAPGNWILYNMYDELPLASSGFSEARRIKWNVDGKFEAGQDTYSLQKSRTIDELVALHYSFGPINTFNKNHPELVDSPDHPLEVMRREMKALGFKDDDRFELGSSVVLLLSTKTA